VWSHDLAMPGDEPQPWMMELTLMISKPKGHPQPVWFTPF
jgi:hypothetical protein